MRIAIDAMGGDHAPNEIVHGAVEGLHFLEDGDELVLVGQQERIQPLLPSDPAVRRRVGIHHASQIIEMEDSPVEALRVKKDSSIGVMAKLAADRQVDAVISAGNTGACAAACQVRMRTMPGVQRPGILVVLPSFAGPVSICDVGANVEPKPFHLLQYAQMAAVYSEEMLGIANPRVALLSIGGEQTKGNILVKQARELIRRDASLNFVGYVEGRDLYGGACDVAVCDGFVGNVVLKLTEGLAEGLFKTIKQEIAAESPELAPRFDPVVRAIWARHDYSEYGGAPLLGLNGTSIICHGSSDRRAIKNAVGKAVKFVRSDVNRVILGRLTEEEVVDA